MGRPGIIVITMGDPAGVGPEIIIKGFESFDSDFIPLVIGDWNVMTFYKKLLRMNTPLNLVSSVSEVKEGVVNVLSTTELEPEKDFIPGSTNSLCGEAVVNYIKVAVSLCMEKKAVAMVTAPISKEAIHKAGYSYPGHTELLADLTNTKKYAMMLTGGGIRVVLVTIHVALRDVPKMITKDRLRDVIELTAVEISRLYRLSSPKIAVCALNPHAGEKGAFGTEEIEIISPVIEELRSKYEVSGPHPADTVFYWHRNGKYHVVVAMFHDQGLIPVKLCGFDEGVNVTLGLPIIRTSPDHGTAFDIAGKGVANPKSFVCAFNLAAYFAGISN